MKTKKRSVKHHSLWAEEDNRELCPNHNKVGFCQKCFETHFGTKKLHKKSSNLLNLMPIYAPENLGKKLDKFDIINYNFRALDHNIDVKLAKILEVLMEK